MARVTTSSNGLAARPDAKTNHWSLAMSLFLHSLLLVVLVLVLRPVGSVGGDEDIRRVSVVLASPTDVTKQEYLDETDVTEQNQTPDAASSSSASSVAESAPPPLDLADIKDLAGPLTPTDVVDISADAMATAQSNNFKAEFQLSDEDLKLIARDQQLLKSRQPVGKAITLNVFGSGNLTGHRFVFVIDRSQSMGTDGLGVLTRARRELKMAVDQLEQNHSFQVVAYNDRTVTILQRSLLKANTENKRMVPQFIGNLAAFGPTSHQSGLVAGLAFQPDVVVFLTDGGHPELNQAQLKTLRQMAGRTTQVHCIQFGSGPLQNRDNFMTDLARQTNGSFRYINVNNWSR